MSAAAAVPNLERPATGTSRQTRQTKERKTFIRRPTAYHRESGAPINNAGTFPGMVCRLFMSPKRESDTPLAKVSGASQMTVLLYVMFRQWGDGRQLAWVRLSIAEIANDCGLPPNTVDDALSDLVARGLLEASKRGCVETYSHGLKPEGWDKMTGAAIEYRTDCAWWPSAPVYDPDVKAAAEPAPEQPEPEQPEPEHPVAHSVLASGRSVEIPVTVACADAPNGARFHVSCQNRVGVPMRIEQRAVFGQVRLTLHPFVEQAVPTAGAGKNPVTLRVHRGALPAKSIDSSIGDGAKLRAADLAAVASLLRQHFNQPRDDAFAGRVLFALDGAPVAQLAEFAAREIPAMRTKRRAVTSGILLYFAEKVGAAWREAAAEREAEAAAEQLRAKDARRLIGTEELQRMAASSDPIEREYARQVLALEAGPLA